MRSRRKIDANSAVPLSLDKSVASAISVVDIVRISLVGRACGIAGRRGGGRSLRFVVDGFEIAVARGGCGGTRGFRFDVTFGLGGTGIGRH